MIVDMKKDKETRRSVAMTFKGNMVGILYIYGLKWKQSAPRLEVDLELLSAIHYLYVRSLFLHHNTLTSSPHHTTTVPSPSSSPSNSPASQPVFPQLPSD